MLHDLNKFQSISQSNFATLAWCVAKDLCDRLKFDVSLLLSQAVPLRDIEPGERQLAGDLRMPVRFGSLRLQMVRFLILFFMRWLSCLWSVLIWSQLVIRADLSYTILWPAIHCNLFTCSICSYARAMLTAIYELYDGTCIMDLLACSPRGVALVNIR